MSFAALRKQSQNSLAAMQAMVEKEANGGSSFKPDERYWTLKGADKRAVCSAIIRFLPAPDGEVAPFVKVYEYAIGGPKWKGWYIERCRSTIGEKDPVNEYFFQIRGDGKSDSKKEAAKPFARTPKYISNILVVKDPQHPENDGKVFLFKFGNAILEKINAAIAPPDVADELDDELGGTAEKAQPFDPFNAWSGANFKIHKDPTAGFKAYERSRFGACGPISEDDDEIEEIWNQCYSLKAEVEPDKFKSYEDLRKRFDKFLDNNELPPLNDGENSSKDEPKPKKRVEKDDDPEPAPTTKKVVYEKPWDDDDIPEKPSTKVPTKTAKDYLLDDEVDNVPPKPKEETQESVEGDEWDKYRALVNGSEHV